MSNSKHNTDVVVVGAGLAGLVAARDVIRAGRTAIVLEARDRVGGRIRNHPLPGGAVVEVGGQWIGPTQDRIAVLAEDVGVETFATYGVGRSQILLDGAADDPTVDAAFAELERMAAELPLEAPWTAERAREWDAQTIHSWLQARVTEPRALALLRLVVTSIFTAEPDELSLLHVLVYIRSAGSLGLLTQAAQERRFVGGSQLVAIRLAEHLGAERMRLAQPVRRIRQSTDVVVAEADGISVTAKRAIVAVPLGVADRIAYEPALPAERAQLHQRVAPGAIIKIHFVYDEPFWRGAELNGRVLSAEGPITVTFDNSPPSGTPGVLVGFVDGDYARRFARLSDDARREAAIGCVTRYFGPHAAHPVEYVETDWSTEEWTRGCFGANLQTGAWTRYGEALRRPVGLVHWAGAETSTVWLNYMEGAVRSGERAAAEVVAALR